MTNGGALSLQTSGSLTFTHTGPDTLEIHAPTAGHLQQVEEAGKNGYRILNSDSDNHGDIGEKALDLSYQSGTSKPGYWRIPPKGLHWRKVFHRNGGLATHCCREIFHRNGAMAPSCYGIFFHRNGGLVPLLKAMGKPLLEFIILHSCK